METLNVTETLELTAPVCEACARANADGVATCKRPVATREECGGAIRPMTRDEWRACEARITRERAYDAYGALYRLCESNDAVRERLRCMYDLATLLGGATLESWTRCAEKLANGKAKLSMDSAPFSLCFHWAGMFGGWIWHASAREWGTHT